MSERTLRLIEVTKLRGSDFRSGRHTYRLSADGITVFPRLADPLELDDYRLGEDRISSGIAPLDTMLAEGYMPGGLTLVAGPSGAIDEWVYELLDLVETTGATRVMIDSLSDLQYATPDPVRFREFTYSLTQRLSRAGVGPIMTSEIPDLFHVGRLAEYGISHLSDNVILLQYLRADSRLLRTVTVLKSRASAHDPEIREF